METLVSPPAVTVPRIGAVTQMTVVTEPVLDAHFGGLGPCPTTLLPYVAAGAPDTQDVTVPVFMLVANQV